MSRVGPLFVLLLLVVALPRVARAAWDTPFWGTPIMEVFRPQETGNANITYCAAEELVSGQLWFGTDNGLSSFNGRSWRRFSFGTTIASLAVDSDRHRFWFGGWQNLGWVDFSADGEPHLTSLRDKLPFSSDELGAVWATYATRTGIYFVSPDRVLRWNGAKFDVWRYPTSATRVFPIIFEDRLWFYHLESGLYRVGDNGPEKIVGPEQLPKEGGLLWLGREAGALIGASNTGFWTIGPQPRCLSPAELNTDLAQHRLVAVTELGNGFRAVCTLTNGVTVVDRHLRVVRHIGEGQGVRGTLYGQYLSREGALWLFNDNNLVRCDARNATAAVRLDDTHRPILIQSLVAGGESVWIAAQNKIYRARRDGNELKLELFATSPHALFNILPIDEGLLAGGFRAITFYRGDGAATEIVNLPHSWGLLAALRQPGHVLATYESGWLELTRMEAGRWNTVGYPNKPGAVRSAAEDAHGNLWASSFGAAPGKWVHQAGEFKRADVPPEFATANASPSIVIGRATDTLLVAGRHVYLTREGVPTLLCELPGEPIAAALSGDQRRLYVAYRRGTEVPTSCQEGLGQIDISADGKFAGWKDLVLSTLIAVGGVNQLATTLVDDRDTLWIGGAEGVMQARPAELSEWRPPAPPRITLTAPPVAGTAFDSAARIPLRIDSPEITLRPALRFQTKFGHGGEDWSAPTDRTTFEFSNLREGDYSFSARSVNPLGQVSAPTYFTFTVRPPWYRSPWAYTIYTAAAALGVFGAVRYRERRMRQRTLELTRLVRERTAELEKANAAKDEFLASMSHEIRNPMNGVVGLSAAIDIAPLDHEGQYRFGLLRHCASHLASLLEDILDFSKLQAGTIELDPQPFAPADLLEAVSAITAPVSAAAEVKVEFALGPSVPPRLVGDARRLRQVLLNYVGNAVKYAPQGTIRVTAWARAAGPERVALTFAVSDEGPGIPAEEQERVFEQFARGAGARSSRIPGTGMGLAVCRRLAEKMGGRAWVESPPGEGSTFFLALELPIAPAGASGAPAHSLAGLLKRALVVDDEDYNLIPLAAMLERRGFAVRSALKADEALRLVLAHKPDVIFLDYDMPDTTGPQLARRIREVLTPLGRQPLVIATTAYSTVAKRDECLAAGMDGFLAKPIVEERLRLALEEAIQRRAPAGARHVIMPHAEVFDPLENLQTLARQHARTLEAELAEFSAAAEAEFAELNRALTGADSIRAARAAHRISGRFGFLHAAAPMRRALQLEEICHAADWAKAQPLATELAQDWETLRASLSRLTCAATE